MAHNRSLAICCLLLSCVPAAAADGGPKKDAELKWAKEVASDFLRAGMQYNYASAESLVTADFRKILKEGSTSVTDRLSHVVASGGGADSWALSCEEIAPDKDEARFRGTFKRKKGEADFSLRVVKEKESGKWRVSFFSAGDYEEPKKPKK